MRVTTKIRSAADRLRRDGWFADVHIVDLVVWYSLTAVLVFAVPVSARLNAPPWSVPAGDEIQAWYWTMAFVTAASGVTLVRAVRGHLSIAWCGLLLIGPWVLGFLALTLRSGVPHSRMIALASVALGAFFLALPAFISTGAKQLVARTVLAVAVTGAVFRAIQEPESAAGPMSVATNTARVPVVIHYEPGLVPVAGVPGGALTPFGSGLLLGTATGSWYEITWDSGGERLTARALPLPAPMSRDGLSNAPQPVPLLRVTGLAVDASSDTSIVYAAHEVWRSGERCLAIQVSALRFRGMTSLDSVWRPVYSTHPCLDTSQSGFDPYESGGRLLILPDGALLLTVGDYGLNKDTSNVVAQRTDVDYGKTLRIDSRGIRTLHTLGHRNPSGLASDRAGNLWLAEHGPRGGDELNLLQAGANYGWPLVTYGTDYGQFRWRFSTPPESSKRFMEPAFALVPSVALSSLISVKGQLFEEWSGDLLAGSLKAEQLLRFRMVGSRAVYVEPIPIRRRIRDLAEAPDGRIVLWTDVGDLVWLAPAPEVLLGASVFEACVRCHGPIDEYDALPTGPGLARIDGRRVASLPGFEYSSALRRVGGRWTEERLDAFLRSPSAFAPGTSMLFPGIADSAQRRALVEFLRRPWVATGGD